MGFYGFTDLNAADIGLVHIALGFTGAQVLPVRKFDHVLIGVNLRDGEPLILSEPAGHVEQVAPELQPFELSLDMSRLKLRSISIRATGADFEISMPSK
jgi:hypothetical protein